MSLPLFPLRTVLVPGLMLPLHIFEERYRILIAALLALPEDAVRQFGVVAIRAGSEAGDERPEIYPIGCTAQLREVTPYSDGRFDVVAVGEQRFRILQVQDDDTTPYLRAEVEFLPEQDGAQPQELAAARSQVVTQFAQYQRALGADLAQVPEDPRVASYLVAAAMVLELPRRQELLEKTSVLERLKSEHALLRAEQRLISAFTSLPAADIPGERPSQN